MIINGKLRIFKSVLIFLVKLFNQPHKTAGLNYTYSILQDHLNISQASLSTIQADEHQGVSDTCDDVTQYFAQKANCKMAFEAQEIEKFSAKEQALENEKNFPFTVLWFIILTAIILQIVHQVLICVKKKVYALT